MASTHTLGRSLLINKAREDRLRKHKAPEGKADKQGIRREQEQQKREQQKRERLEQDRLDHERLDQERLDQYPRQQEQAQLNGPSSHALYLSNKPIQDSPKGGQDNQNPYRPVPDSNSGKRIILDTGPSELPSKRRRGVMDGEEPAQPSKEVPSDDENGQASVINEDISGLYDAERLNEQLRELEQDVEMGEEEFAIRYACVINTGFEWMCSDGVTRMAKLYDLTELSKCAKRSTMSLWYV